MKWVAIVLCFLGSLASTPASAKDMRGKVARATEILEELLTGENSPPSELLTATSCVIVVPNLVKGAFGIGARRGYGVLSCRLGESEWSPPAFMKITGVSFGLQIGGQAIDLVLLVVDDTSLRKLLGSKFTIGVDASIAAGPRSRQVGTSTDYRFDAEIYSYATSRGLFAGAAVDGARLSLYRKPIPDYYGAYVRPEDILFGETELRLPVEASVFLATLP